MDDSCSDFGQFKDQQSIQAWAHTKSKREYDPFGWQKWNLILSNQRSGFTRLWRWLQPHQAMSPDLKKQINRKFNHGTNVALNLGPLKPSLPSLGQTKNSSLLHFRQMNQLLHLKLNLDFFFESLVSLLIRPRKD